MREVANRLEHMGCINRDIRLTAMLTGPACDRLIALRADFTFESNQLLNQLTAKLTGYEQARLASRILAAFVSMQQLLTGHQQSWTSAEVERDPDGYIAASLKVHAVVINFLEGALDAVEIAARPQGNDRPAISPFAQAAPDRLTGTR